jgi:hypothetical protein
VPITPQALLRRALDSLPAPGRATHFAGNYSDTFAGTSFVYDDGHGAAAVILGLFSDPAANSIEPCAAGSPGCRVLADGAHALIAQGKQYQDGRTPNPMEWSVTLAHPGGLAVNIFEYNSPQTKGEPSRAEPPFGIDALVAWADGRQWVAAIPPAEAKSTAHLFVPVALDGGSSTKEAQKRRQAVQRSAQDAEKRAQRARNCLLAKEHHKTPPSYCSGG